MDEINNKIKEIGGLNVEKAREIILDAIGDEKKQKKNKVNGNSPPLPSIKKEDKQKSAGKREFVERKKILKANKIKNAPNKLSAPFLRRARSAANAAIYIFLTAILLFIIFYSLLSGLIIRFGIDNKITRGLSEFLPIPAAITKTGIIEYYTYKDALIKNARKR